MTSTVVIRRARPSDREAMLSITRNVWDGTDYLPFVWDRWLRDPDGLLVVAMLEGEVVGLQHMTLHPDGSAWLEGIRVAEEARGRGVGAALAEYGVSWAREMGCPAVRLSTSSHNPASNRIVERAGFAVAGAYYPCCAAPGDLPQGEMAIRVAHPSESDNVLRFLAADAGKGAAPFYTEGWTAYRLDQERLRLLLAVHAVMIAGDGAIEGVAIGTSVVTRSALRLGYLAGSEEAMVSLARRVRWAAHLAGLPRIRATVAVDEPGLAALRLSGFDPEYGFTMLLYERLLT